MSELLESKDFNLFLGRATSYILILSILKYDSEHSGYSLIKRLEELTDNRLKFRAGTVYPQIEKLKEAGLIERHIQDAPSRSEDLVRQKAVYTLTSKGVATLSHIRRDWDDFSNIIDTIITGIFRDKK